MSRNIDPSLHGIKILAVLHPEIQWPGETALFGAKLGSVLKRMLAPVLGFMTPKRPILLKLTRVVDDPQLDPKGPINPKVQRVQARVKAQQKGKVVPLAPLRREKANPSLEWVSAQ